ncbi:MAG: hypothetical protein JWN85_3770, partial [Gammaproteobacteria bacterium]|nr:hypothetical protein [Gammaproteobacteria bacterium]
ARLALRVAAPEVAVGLSMARKSRMRRRIEAVQRQVFRARLPRRRATCVVVVAALATFLLGGLGLGRSNAKSPPAVEAPGRVCPQRLARRSQKASRGSRASSPARLSMRRP